VPGKLPFEIREAVVQVCGKAFWLKDPLRAVLLEAGVPPEVYDRFSDESKYKIARHVLSELDCIGERGFEIQRAIVTTLCRLRKLPDENVTNRDSARAALSSLRELAIAQKLYVEERRNESDDRVSEARRKQAAITARAAKVEELRRAFASMVTASTDPQDRGYGLEDLLAELFELHDITYRRPYRTGTEQIDGHFPYKGFDYLVEARWRKDSPSESDLGAFKTKIDKKLTSTRGLFLSVPGFRQEVVLEFTRGVSSNIVLVDGADLSTILEGRISLTDALQVKIAKAAQEGLIYYPLSGSV
jgi:restriction endonuclease Mrr